MAVIGGTAVAAAALTAAALTLANRNEGSSAQKPPAIVTTVAAAVVASADPAVVTVPPTAAPASTQAPVGTVAPTTTAAPATTVAITTTLLALPSGAGVYTITYSDVLLTFDGTTSAGSATPPEPWTFAGPCDGSGDCTITSTGASTLTDPGGQLVLASASPGTYTVSFEKSLFGCGAGIANLVISIGNGSLAGTFDFTDGACGVSFALSGVLSG